MRWHPPGRELTSSMSWVKMTWARLTGKRQQSSERQKGAYGLAAARCERYADAFVALAERGEDGLDAFFLVVSEFGPITRGKRRCAGSGGSQTEQPGACRGG